MPPLSVWECILLLPIMLPLPRSRTPPPLAWTTAPSHAFLTSHFFPLVCSPQNHRATFLKRKSHHAIPLMKTPQSHPFTGSNSHPSRVNCMPRSFVSAAASESLNNTKWGAGLVCLFVSYVLNAFLSASPSFAWWVSVDFLFRTNF